MKTLVVFVWLLPLGLAAQMMHPSISLADTRSMAMGEALTATNFYSSMAEVENYSLLRWQTANHYGLKQTWSHQLAYSDCRQHLHYSILASYADISSATLGLRATYGKDVWRAGAALHFACTRPSNMLMENFLCIQASKEWQIKLLLWHLAWQKQSLHAFHLSGTYAMEQWCLLGELSYAGKGDLVGHYALEYNGGACCLRLGCRFPQPRPAIGFAWKYKHWMLSSACLYDFRLGLIACMELSYLWPHET